MELLLALFAATLLAVLAQVIGTDSREPNRDRQTAWI